MIIERPIKAIKDLLARHNRTLKPSTEREIVRWPKHRIELTYRQIERELNKPRRLLA